MPTVVQLPAGKALTVRVAAGAFLDSLRNPNTVRSHGVGVGKTAERIGEGRPLGSVADDEIGEALELLWGTAAVNTWNARRAAVLSWPGRCKSYGYDGPAVPAWTKRPAVPDSETPARSKMAVDRLIARREVHLREKTLWRMLYETAGRSEEILGVNIEDLDLAAGRCPVKAKGARSKARRRGQAREDFVLETVYWDAGTARLLPRLLRAVPAGRCSSPTAAPARERWSARATCARTPARPRCPIPDPRCKVADAHAPVRRWRRSSQSSQAISFLMAWLAPAPEHAEQRTSTVTWEQ